MLHPTLHAQCAERIYFERRRHNAPRSGRRANAGFVLQQGCAGAARVASLLLEMRITSRLERLPGEPALRLFSRTGDV